MEACKLKRYVQKNEIVNYDKLLSSYFALTNQKHQLDAEEWNNFAAVEVELEGKIYFIIIERVKDAPTGAIFVLNEEKSTPLVASVHLIGEIKGKWTSGPAAEPNTRFESVISQLSQWYENEGQNEIKKVIAENPSIDKLTPTITSHQFTKDNIIHKASISLLSHSRPDEKIYIPLDSFVLMEHILDIFLQRFATQLKNLNKDLAKITAKEMFDCLDKIMSKNLAKYGVVYWKDFYATPAEDEDKIFDLAALKSQIVEKYIPQAPKKIVLYFSFLIEYIIGELLGVNSCENVFWALNLKLSILRDVELRQTLLEDLSKAEWFQGKIANTRVCFEGDDTQEEEIEEEEEEYEVEWDGEDEEGEEDDE